MRFQTFRAGNVSGAVYRLVITGAPFLFTLSPTGLDRPPYVT